jgi:hypothetical protein
MVSRLSIAILAGCLVAAQDLVVAQVPGGDVTLRVPLNLTKLSTDITKVRVSCRLQSTALIAYDLQGQESHGMAGGTDVPVSNGQVVTTATVVFSNYTLTNPGGATASYQCNLVGFDRTGISSNFTESNPDPKFRLTPAPGILTGTFAW